jgi:presenilin-like A22 family membrane protease
MPKGKTDYKKEILPIIFMGFIFILVHCLALIVTTPFRVAGVRSAFEDPNNPMNVVIILSIMIVFTVVILLIAKFWKKKLIQILILGAIGYTSAYLFFPLLSLIIPRSISINLYFTIPIAGILAVILAIILVYILYKYPEWYVIDISGIIVGAGAIAIFGMSLGVLLVIILLIVLAIYDAISVYKTKHMIDLADTVMDLKLPILLVIPKIRKYSLIKETKSLKEKIKGDKEREAFFIGLGDIVMPGILVTSSFNNIEGGLLISASVIIGTLIGFSILMVYVMKGKPQAGLPLLCGGAIAGYIISSLILFRELRGIAFSI